MIRPYEDEVTVKTEIKLTGAARSAQKESPVGFPTGLRMQATVKPSNDRA